ncbi:MAG TPA: NHLP leader peptide family RiPP precursor [Stellaceae bacterium]|nr:NHLP leader peptide family RiPP precursor [Stellaceae bacterium]
MTAAAPSLSRHDIEAKIVKRCWENDAFRKEFVSDPAGCFVKYLNAPKAQLPKITVHEEQPGSWHIVLPAKPTKSGELSDDELEKVAGGTDIVTVTLAVSLGMSVTALSASVAVGYGGASASSGW